MTLGQLQREATPEEMILWVAFFELQRDEQNKAMNKSKRGRG